MRQRGYTGDDEKNPLNPADWGLVGWGWLLMVFITGLGVYIVINQSPAPPQREGPRYVRRGEAPGGESADTGIKGGTFYRQAEEYRREGNRSSGGSGGNRGSPSGPPDNDDSDNGQSSEFPKVFKGQHINQTTPFNVKGPWTLEWKTNGPMMQVYVKRTDGSRSEAVVTKTGLKSSPAGGSTKVDVSGEVYLQVNSLGDWVVKVKQGN